MSYLLETEQHLIGLLLNQGSAIWGDLNLLAPKDFSPVRRALFSVIKQQLDQSPPGSVTPVILVERLKSYGHSDKIGEVDALTYLNGLQVRGRMIEPKEAVNLLKELKGATVKRELIEACDEAKKRLKEIDSNKLSEMVGVVDETLSSVNTQFYQSETTLMFDGYVDKMRERMANPIKSEDIGFQGPFPSMNKVLGNIVGPASLVIVGARTGNQKSTLGFFYNTYLCERYNLVYLHLDVNEMPRAQLLDRATCCFSQGQIPLWAVKSGEFGQNRESRRIWFEEIEPKVAKIGKLIHYQNVGKLKPREVVAFIRRFYYKHVGRGGHLLVNLDYVKGSSALRSGSSKGDSEYQLVGDYIDELKGLINDEISASVWASVQQNRGGITSNIKNADDILDSEANFGLSDRIIQMATDGFSLRFKVPTELGKEKNLFGNMKLEQHKGRDLVGKEFAAALAPIKVGNRYMKNYYNLNSHGFHFTDAGDLRAMVDRLGYGVVDLSTDKTKREMP